MKHTFLERFSSFLLSEIKSDMKCEVFWWALILMMYFKKEKWDNLKLLSCSVVSQQVLMELICRSKRNSVFIFIHQKLGLLEILKTVYTQMPNMSSAVSSNTLRNFCGINESWKLEGKLKFKAFLGVFLLWYS